MNQVSDENLSRTGASFPVYASSGDDVAAGVIGARKYDQAPRDRYKIRPLIVHSRARRLRRSLEHFDSSSSDQPMAHWFWTPPFQRSIGVVFRWSKVTELAPGFISTRKFQSRWSPLYGICRTK